MSEQQDSARIAQGVFEAFGRGDIPALLDMLTEDVEWLIPGDQSIIPYAGMRRGRAEVLEFFKAIGGAVEFERFEPREFLAQGDRVAVIGFERGRVRSTGRTFDNDWTIIFTTRDGKVSNFRSYEDTAALVEAFRLE